MRIPDSCAKCLYDRQRERMPDAAYLSEVRALLDARGEDDTSPLMVYRFNQVYARMFGASDGYAAVKRRYNDLVLGMEDVIRNRIEAVDDPLRMALACARVGNYIDYGAMDTVDEATFMDLFECAALRPEEMAVYNHLVSACAAGERFLLIADNCGEIVLDRLFLEQLKKRFPRLALRVMTRGAEVLNDVTPEDAIYAGVDRVAEIVSNGLPIAGTVCDLLPEPARRALDDADVILAKGQGNYESLSGRGYHAFYCFLCKCDLFTGRFGVPPLTGMLVEEAGR